MNHMTFGLLLVFLILGVRLLDTAFNIIMPY